MNMQPEVLRIHFPTLKLDSDFLGATCSHLYRNENPPSPHGLNEEPSIHGTYLAPHLSNAHGIKFKLVGMSRNGDAGSTYWPQFPQLDKGVNMSQLIGLELNETIWASHRGFTQRARARPTTLYPITGLLTCIWLRDRPPPAPAPGIRVNSSLKISALSPLDLYKYRVFLFQMHPILPGHSCILVVSPWTCSLRIQVSRSGWSRCLHCSQCFTASHHLWSLIGYFYIIFFTSKPLRVRTVRSSELHH